MKTRTYVLSKEIKPRLNQKKKLEPCQYFLDVFNDGRPISEPRGTLKEKDIEALALRAVHGTTQYRGCDLSAEDTITTIERPRICGCVFISPVSTKELIEFYHKFLDCSRERII